MQQAQIRRLLADAVNALNDGKPNKAAGLLREAADEINAQEAKVLTEEAPTPPPAPKPDPYTQARDLQSCGRGVHVYGPVNSNGWAECQSCGFVNVAPPQGPLG